MLDRTIPSARGAVARTDNNPPGPIAAAKEAMAELSAYLKETPVVQTAADEKQGGAFLERTRIALKEAREERDARTRPLNDQLQAVRRLYDIVRERTRTNPGGILEVAYNELRRRLTAYATAVEAARIAEAERLRHEAEEKERIAREAERHEQDAIACADVGECTDVGAAIQQADTAFGAYQKAERAAVIAEHDVPMRIGSVMGNKAITMRTLRKLVVVDAIAAVRALGPTDDICAALVKAAKAYEAAHGELPAGIAETYERSM